MDADAEVPRLPRLPGALDALLHSAAFVFLDQSGTLLYHRRPVTQNWGRELLSRSDP